MLHREDSIFNEGKSTQILKWESWKPWHSLQNIYKHILKSEIYKYLHLMLEYLNPDVKKWYIIFHVSCRNTCVHIFIWITEYYILHDIKSALMFSYIKLINSPFMQEYLTSDFNTWNKENSLLHPNSYWNIEG